MEVKAVVEVKGGGVGMGGDEGTDLLIQVQ